MALIEGFLIQNYRALKDVAMGRIGTTLEFREAEPLTPLTAVIGRNGSGKSSIFDAFGFLADCMDNDLETVCNDRKRGGFDKILSNGVKEPITLTVYYREGKKERPITYTVSIGKDESGLPIVLEERLRQCAKNKDRGQPRSFLHLKRGYGSVWIGDDSVEDPTGDNSTKRDVEFDPHRLAIVSLAEQYKENPRIAKFKAFIKDWYLSYFHPDSARVISQAGAEKRLYSHGDNLGNVVQHLERNHPRILKDILRDISTKIPGIGTIETHRETITNNLFLLFKDKGFAKPFTQQQMSDGTLKMLCYLLLIRSPEPPPFICIEEPENGLYHKLLETLVAEFREHATGKKGGSQVFITTHDPYFVNAIEPNELWILEKGEDGFSTIRRADEDPLIVNMVEEGVPLGGLWYSEYLDERPPYAP